jgi:hypothetical protein
VQVGVQYVQTEFKQLTGPEADMRLSVGDEMTLNWEFDGFGDQYCYSDGKLFNNMGDYNCRSPVQIRLPDRRDHTFRVALQVSSHCATHELDNNCLKRFVVAARPCIAGIRRVRDKLSGRC